jgi:hypothetical protein
VIRRWPFPWKSQLSQLGPKLIDVGKRSPEPIADDFGAIFVLDLPEVRNFRLERIGIKRSIRIGQQPVDRLVELARQEVLQLCVRPTGLLRRPVCRLAAKRDPDQAHDGVTL